MLNFWPFAQTPAEAPPESKICGYPAKKVWIILAVVLALVVIGALVAVACFLLLKGPSQDDLELADQMMKIMNLSANPCEDFYEYACGGWLSSENVNDTEVTVSFLGSMTETTKQQMLALLNRSANPEDPIYATQARKFFSACNNVKRLEARGTKHFLKFLGRFGKFPLLDKTWTESDFDFQRMVTKLAPLGAASLFTVSTFPAKYAKSKIMLLIEYPRPENPNEKKSGWMIDVLEKLGLNLGRVTKLNVQSAIIEQFGISKIDEIHRVLNLEEQLHQFVESTARATTGDHGIEMTTFRALNYEANWLDWSAFLKGITTNISGEFALSDKDHVLVRRYDKLKNLYNKVVSSKRDLANLMLKNLLSYTFALDGRFQQFAYLDTVTPFFGENPMNRTDKCLFETLSMLPDSVHRMYDDEYPSEGSRSFIKDMFNDIKVEFGRIFDKHQWFDNETTTKSKETVNALKVEVGLPEFLQDVDLLNSMYESIPTDEYFESVIALSRLNFENRAKTAVTNANNVYFWRKHWNANLNTYSITDNVTVIPTESLIWPVFNPRWRSSMKYGALGFNLAADFFKIANVYGRWDYIPDAKRGFHYYFVICFDYQMRGMVYSDAQMEQDWPSSESHETMWFSYGMKLSYMAHRRFQERSGGVETPLPKLNLNQDQLFFLNFAQMHCQKFLSRREKFPAKIDKIQLERRIIAAVRGSKEFAAAFSCEPESPMNPKKKCNIMA